MHGITFKLVSHIATNNVVPYVHFSDVVHIIAFPDVLIHRYIDRNKDTEGRSLCNLMRNGGLEAWRRHAHWCNVLVTRSQRAEEFSQDLTQVESCFAVHTHMYPITPM